MTPPPALCRQTWRLAAASVLATILLGLALWLLRRGLDSPYEVAIYRRLALFEDYHAVVPFVAVLLLALLPALRNLGARIAGWCAQRIAVVALTAVAVAAAGAHGVYHAHPLSLDEYAMVLQSRIFAEGRLTGVFPPALADWLVPPSIQGKFLKVSLDTGAVAATYWPGFSLLLAPFSAAGVPWLLNPLILGATLLVMHRLGRALFPDSDGAGYVVLLTLASPVILVNAMSYYAMPAHLLANATYMLLLLAPTPKRAVLAGLVGSFALVLHNPIPHLLFALPWIVWLAFSPNRARLLAGLVAGYLPLCLLLGLGWATFLDGLDDAKAGGMAAAGGAYEAFVRRLHTVLEWYYQPSLEMHFLGFAKIWLWAVPALVAAAAIGGWRLRNERGLWVVIGASGWLTFVGYFYIPFDQGHGWGYRYFHSAWLVLPLFAVCAFRTPARTAPSAAPAPPPALAGYMGACALLALTLLATQRALQVEQFIGRHLAQAPAAASGEARVSIVYPHGYYNWDLAQNDPFLRNRPIRLVSRGPERDRTMMAALFPQYRLLSEDRRGTVWGLPGPERN
jgi:hypothetical protein